MKNFWHKNWFIKVISLLIAILMVLYIDSTQTGYMTQGQTNRTKQTATETQTIQVPLQVSVDTDKYYVVGYPEKVKLQLTGTNSLVTSAINTQNFRAYLDLTKLSTGQHQVTVKVTGLNHGLSYSLNPKTVKVNIERRKSTVMPIQIEYNKNAAARGYHLGTAKADPERIAVTGAKGEVDQIDQVVAKATLPSDLTDTYSRQVLLVAEDKKGRQLNVVLQPSTTHVEIPVRISHKKVKLNLQSKNEASNKIYSVTANKNNVELYGQAAALKKIKQLNVAVNLKNITNSVTKNVFLPMPHDVVRLRPNKVQVQIKVKSTNNSKEN